MYEYKSVGARPWRSKLARAELEACWRQLLPSLKARFGRSLPPHLRLISEPGAAPNAQALPDDSIIFYKSYYEFARSIAGAVAASGTSDRAALLRNLATVALSARRGTFVVRFPGAEKKAPALYRETLRGVLANVIAHELGHLVSDHQALEHDSAPRATIEPARLQRSLAAYFPPRVRRRTPLASFVQQRGTLLSQAEELDADRVGVDLVVASGMSPIGLLADHLVTAMKDGLYAEPTVKKSHPPGLLRLRDASARLREQGPPLLEGISRRELARALREAAGADPGR
jgi:hypothetical protein